VIKNPKPITIEKQFSKITSIASNTDGNKLITSHENGKITLWEASFPLSK